MDFQKISGGQENSPARCRTMGCMAKMDGPEMDNSSAQLSVLLDFQHKTDSWGLDRSFCFFFFLIPISIFNPFSRIFSLSNSFPTIFTPFISILLSKSSIPSQFLSNLLQDFTYPSYFLCFEPNNLSFQPPNHQNQPRGTILLQELGKISISYFLYITSRISKVSLMFWRVSCAMFWIPWERLILLIVGTFLCFYLVNLISVWWFKLLENDGISMTWVLHASWILFRNCVFILWCVIHDYFISSRTSFDFSLRLQGMRNRESDW